jgi:hypothetical protein
VIGNLCKVADSMPMIQLRRKPGIKPSDLLSKRKMAMEALLKLDDLTNLDVIPELDGFITVRLKQLVLNFLIEFMDEMLDWQSPLKTEVCFGTFPSFADPPVEDGTKLKRVGTTLNPFYPHPIRTRGHISIDLAIPDYRKEPMRKQNLFAIIEIKFPGDAIKKDQLDLYKKLSEAAANKKTSITTIPRTNGNLPVGKGCRLALFRYPEDMPVKSRDEKEDVQNKPSKPSSGFGRRRH